MGHHDESLIDKVKNAFGMGDDDQDQDREGAIAAPTRTDGAAERADGWAGVPEALYDDTSSYETGIDSTREDAAATEYGGAYREDETPIPTSSAWDRGEAPVGEASFDTEEETIEPERRETGI